MEVDVGYVERTTWSQVVVGAIVTVWYLFAVLSQGVSLAEADWVTPMLWAIGVGIVGSIVVSILWGIVAVRRHPRDRPVADQRDRDIERFGDRIGQAFLVIGGVGALILAMLDASSFWIGNTIYLGFFVSSFVGGVARLIAYRSGMP
ncbi:hypothetical protein [Microbacterium sp.]|uniref:hypothetical protein n=1 Tax=Microbacterium sp. TaxID=51671 RepID=UPI003A88794F